ncbi:hypothetical protein [Pseudomonas sp. NPDC087639]|uniref:hypothetical protein n=1 Tax=Pseudomonas sp. NPDC087639 TaxID=3364445 RepID=UPI0037F80FB7
MADDDKDTDAAKPSGTANLLHHYSQYTAIEREYDSEVASGLMRKALERKGVEETVGGVKSWAAISHAIVSQNVDLDHELEQAQAKADSLVEGLFSPDPFASSLEADSGSDARDLDDSDQEGPEAEYDDFDDDDTYDERSSLVEIYNCESEEDAEDEAYDDMLKLMEKAD